MNDDSVEVFAMLIAVPPSHEEGAICMAGKGTKTTWKGLDKDD